jgi:hypothetical protein
MTFTHDRETIVALEAIDTSSIASAITDLNVRTDSEGYSRGNYPLRSRNQIVLKQCNLDNGICQTGHEMSAWRATSWDLPGGLWQGE